MVSVEGKTLTVMGPKRPRDQKQTSNEQEGFCDVASHGKESTPHRFRCQSHLWSMHLWSAKTPSGLELLEGESVSGMVPRGVVPEADRGYWISAVNVAPDGKEIVTPPGVRNTAMTIYRIPMIAQGFKGRAVVGYFEFYRRSRPAKYPVILIVSVLIAFPLFCVLGWMFVRVYGWLCDFIENEKLKPSHWPWPYTIACMCFVLTAAGWTAWKISPGIGAIPMSLLFILGTLFVSIFTFMSQVAKAAAEGK
jgi:hypothetical protein